MSVPNKTLRSGISIPALGLGTWLMGGDTVRQDTPQIAHDIASIRHALDQGITHIDTAEIYGQGLAEEIASAKHTSFVS